MLLAQVIAAREWEALDHMELSELAFLHGFAMTLSTGRPQKIPWAVTPDQRGFNG
jgi:hypothetical protein